MARIFVFKLLFIGLLFVSPPAFSQKAGGIEVTLQLVHKNAKDTSKSLKSEMGLIVELVNNSMKDIAIPISGVNYEKQVKFYRKNKKGDYELIIHPHVLLQEQQEKSQEYNLKHHKSLSNFLGIDYNFETSLSLDFFKYWDTFDQDIFSRNLRDGLSKQELANFTKNVTWFDSSLNFHFLKSGQRQTVFWNLEFILKEKDDYKITFEPFQFEILISPLLLTSNFEIVNHQFFHSNEIYIKTY